MGRQFTVGWFILVALCACGALSARAEPSETSSSDVYSRLRPEYDPRGVRAGSFFLYPSVSSGAGFNGNVYNDASNTQDYFYALTTGIKLQSAWSRHEFSLLAQSKSVWFSNQVTENSMDWDMTGAMRIDVVRGTELSFDGSYGLSHETRGTEIAGGGTANDPSGPTEFATNAFNAELQQSFSRLKLNIGGGFQRLDYNDVSTLGSIAIPSIIINNDDRDHSIIRVHAKSAVEAWSDTAVFLRGTVTSTDYTQALDDTDLNRDSSEVVLDGGFEFSLSHILIGEIAAGYAQKSFVDPTFPAMSGANVKVALKWFPSMLTNVTIEGGRSNEESSIAGASGFVSTRGGVGVDHELLRNLILSGHVAYENDEYADIGRNDDVLKGSVSGRYLINNNLHLDAGWEFVDRNSSDLPFAYSASQFQLSLTGKM